MADYQKLKETLNDEFRKPLYQSIFNEDYDNVEITILSMIYAYLSLQVAFDTYKELMPEDQIEFSEEEYDKKLEENLQTLNNITWTDKDNDFDDLPEDCNGKCMNCECEFEHDDDESNDYLS